VSAQGPRATERGKFLSSSGKRRLSLSSTRHRALFITNEKQVITNEKQVITDEAQAAPAGCVPRGTIPPPGSGLGGAAGRAL